MLNIAQQSAVVAIIAMGTSMVITTGGTDLSLGAVLIKSGEGAWGITVSLGAGLLCGAINGIVIAYTKLPPFIATYGMMQIARGLTIGYMKGNVIWGFERGFRFLGSGTLGRLPVPVVAGLAVLALVHYVLKYTVFGRRVYLIGDNRTAAHFAGIPVLRTILQVYAISDLVTSFAGLMYVSRLDSAESGLGMLFELGAVAATVVGGTSVKGGRGGILGTVVGDLIITLLRNAMNLLGISSLWQPFVVGLCIVLAVVMDNWMEERRRDRQTV